MKTEVVFSDLKFKVSIYKISNKKVVINLRGDFINELELEEFDENNEYKFVIKKKNKRWLVCSLKECCLKMKTECL